MTTEDVMSALARDAQPVQRLRDPWQRSAMWAAAASIYLAVVTMLLMPAARMGAVFTDVRFAFEQLAAILLGLTAAAAALSTTVPAYGRRIFIAPLAAGTLWIGILVIGVARDVARSAPAGIPFHTDWPCVMAMVTIGALPAAALLHMLRKGAPVTPRLTMALAALSAAVLANVVACLVRTHDTSVTVLLWHGTVALAISGLAGSLSAAIFHWTSSVAPRAGGD